MPGRRAGHLRIGTRCQPDRAMSPPSLRSRRNTFPTCRPIAGVRLATAAAGINYQGPHRRAARAVRPGHRGRRRVHAVEMPVGAGRVVPRQAQGRQGARAGGQFRQRQRLHRQDRPRSAVQFTAKLAAQAVGCKPADVFLASTGVIGEPLDASAFDGVMERLVAQAAPGALARRRQGDHDHRHVPEGRDRDARSSARRPSPSTASPRAPA